MLTVRTNNDLEGWHNRLKSRMNSHGPVSLYLLLLERPPSCDESTKMKGQLYNNSSTTTSKLLRACAGLYGLVTT